MDTVKKEYPVNYFFQILGNLGHDNKLFDRTCPTCKGMYSSQAGVQLCPKCNQELTFITTKDGKPMSVSEGTIYPAFGPNQKAKEVNAALNRKNGMEVIHRFKMFNFADANGNLNPPKNHHLMKSGAQIRIKILNHGVVYSHFLTKEGVMRVEAMIPVYPQYDDTVEYIHGPQAAANTTAVSVNPDGSPAPVYLTPQQKEIVELKATIDRLAAGAGLPTGQVPNVQTATAGAVGAVDVFEKAV